MPEYFTTPFPFDKIIKKSKSIPKLNLDGSIRAHIRSLVLMRVGEFSYDKSLGFTMWEFDKEVFYHERAPYFENKDTQKGLLEKSTHARNHFKENLKKIIETHEIRLTKVEVNFDFDPVDGNTSVYQRKISIEVKGSIKSTGSMLAPSFKMSILYTPFQVESH
jgi:hypothetical protein